MHGVCFYSFFCEGITTTPSGMEPHGHLGVLHGLSGVWKLIPQPHSPGPARSHAQSPLVLARHSWRERGRENPHLHSTSSCINTPTSSCSLNGALTPLGCVTLIPTWHIWGSSSMKPQNTLRFLQGALKYHPSGVNSYQRYK